MSLEHELNQLKRTCRIQIAVIGCGLLIALGLSSWSTFAKREENTTSDCLSVRSLVIKDEDGEVAAHLFANDDGHGRLNMFANNTTLLSISSDADGSLITMRNPDGKHGLMLAPQSVYVFNGHERLCAGMASDTDGFGGVFTTNPQGDALALMGRGKGEVGSVAVYGEDDKPIYLSRRSD